MRAILTPVSRGGHPRCDSRPMRSEAIRLGLWTTLMLAVALPAPAHSKGVDGGPDRQNPIASDEYLVWAGATSFTHPSDVFVEDRASGSVIRINRRPFNGSREGCESRYRRSSASPVGIDGDRVLYVQHESLCGPGRSKLYLYDLESETRTKLGEAPDRTFASGLSGSNILYVEYDEPRSLKTASRLYLSDYLTGQVQLVAESPRRISVGQIAGRYVTYAVRRGKSEESKSWRYDLETSDSVALPQEAGAPAVAADGKAFYAAFRPAGSCPECPGTFLFEYDLEEERSVAKIPCPAQDLFANEMADGDVEVFYVASISQDWCDPQYHVLHRIVVDEADENSLVPGKN